MKYKRLLSCLLLPLMLCGACKKDAVPDGIRTQIRNEVRTVETAVDALRDTYPEKNVLVWVVEGYEYAVASGVQEAINQSLDLSGCGYAVYVHTLTVTRENIAASYRYQDLLRLYLDAGGRCDLLFTGSGYAGIYTENYAYFAENEFLEPLDAYLASPQGAALYNLYGDLYWDAVRVGGKVYGISEFAAYAGGAAPMLAVNVDVLGYFDALDGASVLDAIFADDSVLARIQEGEAGDPRVPFSNACAVTSFMEASVYGSRYVGVSRLPVVIDTETMTAQSLYDLDALRRYITAMDAFAVAGLAEVAATEADGVPSRSAWIYAVEGRSAQLAQDELVDYLQYLEGFSDSEFLLIELPVYGWTAGDVYYQGIYAKSTQKDDAFDLLARVFSDETLNNLFCYGKEMLSYLLVDGQVQLRSTTSPYAVDFRQKYLFRNDAITLPDAEEPVDKADLIAALRGNAAITPLTALHINLKAYQNEYNQLLYVHGQVMPELLSVNKSTLTSALLMDCQARFADAGGLSVLAHIQQWLVMR